MKKTINFIITTTLFFCVTQVQAHFNNSNHLYDDFASMPDSLGVLIIDTTVPELSKSHELYIFTKEDALWMARFVTGESGVKNDANGHAVLWAMFNRFGILRHKVKAWSSFGDFLQQYSTTLQPILKSKGAAKRVWKNYNKDPKAYPIKAFPGYYKGEDKVQKVQYQKHLNLRVMEWEQIHSNIREMILDIVQGNIQNPGIGIATEFASTRIYYKQRHGKFPDYEQWVQYTMDYAENRCKKGMRGCTWIGPKENLYQRKNAFFIDNRFVNVPENAIGIYPLY